MQLNSHEYYNMMPDDKAKIGASYCQDKSVHFDFFRNKDFTFKLENPIVFKIEHGKFSGAISDYQIENCGFFLFSPRLRDVIDKYLTSIDLPKWYNAIVIDLDNKEHEYHILNFFNRANFLDYEQSTFIDKEKTHPIKQRFDIEKIGERLVFNPKSSNSIIVHDLVRKQIKKECTNIYFYGIEKPGRLV
ncbi:MAG: hypothetical protein IR153_10120 [Flavobacterium sp.]|nr:hypothetical protein [Flavobacterium sp.]